MIPLARGCDWTGVSLIHCLSSPYRGQNPREGNPIAIAGSFSLVAGQIRSDLFMCLVFRIRDIMAQPLTWLMLLAIAMGMCLMNGYSIFKAGYLSSTPLTPMGSHQAAGCLPAPREFHPNCGSHRAALIACGVWERKQLTRCRSAVRNPPYRSDVRLDGSIIIPICLLSPYRGQPGIYSRRFLARHGGYRESWRNRYRAYAHHNGKGKDLMNVYGIVKEHPLHRRKRL